MSECYSLRANNWADAKKAALRLAEVRSWLLGEGAWIEWVDVRQPNYPAPNWPCLQDPIYALKKTNGSAYWTPPDLAGTQLVVIWKPRGHNKYWRRLWYIPDQEVFDNKWVRAGLVVPKLTPKLLKKPHLVKKELLWQHVIGIIRDLTCLAVRIADLPSGAPQWQTFDFQDVTFGKVGTQHPRPMWQRVSWEWADWNFAAHFSPCGCAVNVRRETMQVKSVPYQAGATNRQRFYYTGGGATILPFRTIFGGHYGLDDYVRTSGIGEFSGTPEKPWTPGFPWGVPPGLQPTGGPNAFLGLAVAPFDDTIPTPVGFRPLCDFPIIRIDPIPVTFTVQAPSVAAGVNVIVPTLPTSFSVVAPTVTTGGMISLAPLTVSFTAVAPTVAAGTFLELDALPVTFSVVAPTVAAGTLLELDALPVTFSVVAPLVSMPQTVLLPSVDVTFSVVAPLVSVGTLLELDALPVVFSVEDITIMAIVDIPAVAVAFYVEPPNVSAGTTLTLSPVAVGFYVEPPTVIVGTTLTLAPLTTTFSVVAPNVRAGTSLTLAPLTTTFSVVAPTVRAGTTLTLSPLTTTFSVVAPTVTAASGGSTQEAFTGSISPSAWTNPNNMKADDGSNATYSLFGPPNTGNTDFTTFGFTTTGTIDGIEVIVECSESASAIKLDGVWLFWIGATHGSNKGTATEISTSMTVYTFGGPTDTWGSGVTSSNANETSFGCRLTWTRISGSPTVNVDYVKIKVYYH